MKTQTNKILWAMLVNFIFAALSFASQDSGASSEPNVKERYFLAANRLSFIPKLSREIKKEALATTKVYLLARYNEAGQLISLDSVAGEKVAKSSVYSYDKDGNLIREDIVLPEFNKGQVIYYDTKSGQTTISKIMDLKKEVK